MTGKAISNSEQVSNGSDTVLRVAVVALVCVPLIGALIADKFTTQTNIVDQNLKACVTAVLPARHRVNRDRDRVLLLDRQGNTVGRIGLLPTVGDNRLPFALKPAADTVRNQCGRLAKVAVA